MAKLLIYQLVIFFTLLLARPQLGFGNGRGTGKVNYSIPMLADTVPDTKKPVEQQPDVKKPDIIPDVKQPDIIKEVPKSRRKLKPIAVPAPIPVKPIPIKIIKPKIIRQII